MKTDRLIKVLYALVALVSLGICIRYVYLTLTFRTYFPAELDPRTFLISRSLISVSFAFLALFLLYSLRQSKEFRRTLLISLITVALVLPASDLMLGVVSSSLTETEKRQAIAEQMKISFDSRPKLEVVLDFRAAGENYYPAVHPTNFVNSNLNVNGRLYYPVGGLANADVVTCNELGFRATYRSDRYGFNNPDDVWDNKVFDVVFTGDSFTAGACVKQGQNAVDRVRERFPRTLNLGHGGNGPLTELAVMREMLTGRKVKHVVWMYLESEVGDLTVEKKNPILLKYLDEDFTQRIVENHEDINHALIQFVENAFMAESKPADSATQSGLLDKVRQAMTLANIRQRFAKLLLRLSPREPLDYAVFSELLEKAKSEVEEKGGKMVFVYLPSIGYFDDSNRRAVTDKNEVFQIARSHQIDIIDTSLIFENSADPKALFALGIGGHYNEKGYQVVGDAITEYLEGVSASQ